MEAHFSAFFGGGVNDKTSFFWLLFICRDTISLFY